MKRLTGIFICLLAVLVMSHNVGAVALNLNVRYVRSHVGTISAALPNSCRSTATGGVQGTSNDCMFSSPTVATGYGEYLAGDIIEIDFIYLIVAVNDSLDAWAYDIKPVSLGDNTNIAYLGQSFEQLNSSEGMMKYYIRVNSYSSNTYGVSFTGNIHLYNNEYLNAMVTTWRIDNVDLSTINNNLQGVIDAIEDSADSSTEYQQQEQQAVENIENQTTQDTQDQLPDTSTATNLIGNIQSIFTQIGNIQPSNCSIPADFGHLDLGNLNLCTGKENLPFIVTFGAYAFELIFVIGASIILVKQVVNMFDWARGDN